MKKIVLLLFVSLFLFSACKKEDFYSADYENEKTNLLTSFWSELYYSLKKGQPLMIATDLWWEDNEQLYQLGDFYLSLRQESSYVDLKIKKWTWKRISLQSFEIDSASRIPFLLKINNSELFFLVGDSSWGWSMEYTLSLFALEESGVFVKKACSYIIPSEFVMQSPICDFVSVGQEKNALLKANCFALKEYEKELEAFPYPHLKYIPISFDQCEK